MSIVAHNADEAPARIPLGRAEPWLFALALAGLIAVLHRDSLFAGRVLSPADVILAQRGWIGAEYEPSNRLLMDPVLQFEPWLKLTRDALRRGHLPLWNPLAGCGAPLLANGQSAVFDPFHLIVYLGPWPGSLGWLAAARLFVAGLGMYGLAKAWRFGPWGRWFAGLAYPLSGFLTCWLLFPMASVAAWFPWLLLGVEGLRRRPDLGRLLKLALIVALVFVGGHIQTSAHALMGAGLYALAAVAAGRSKPGFLTHSLGAATLGAALGATAILPLADYLLRSPAWGDRRVEFLADGTPTPVRWREAACWVLPYLYGSQRAGQPNVARALGIENLNESAAGYAGTTTLLWLAPLGAWSARRSPVARYLAGLAVLGALGSLRVPPIEHLLRSLPLLDVMDHRRLTLWVAFALVALGGIGLDRLTCRRPPRAVVFASISVTLIATVGLLVGALSLPFLESRFRERADRHYAELPPLEAAARVERQTASILSFLPPYYAAAGGEILLLSALAGLWIVGGRPSRGMRPALAGLAILELFAFADGLNPAIPRDRFLPDAPIIARLRAGLPFGGRALGIGEELPANLLMRYGIADVRNYDSVELSANLDAFETLYEPEPDRPVRSSRRSITWEGVERARDLLRRAAVGAVVGATDPPVGLFDRVETLGALRIGWWDGDSPAVPLVGSDGTFSVSIAPTRHQSALIVPVTFDPAWVAMAGGRRFDVARAGPFLAVMPGPATTQVDFQYRPRAVRWGLLLAGGAVVLWLAGAIVARRKKGSKPLGVFSSIGLESIPTMRRPRRSRPAPTSRGRGADGPLQV